MYLTILTPNEERFVDSLDEPFFIGEVHSHLPKYKVGIKLNEGLLVGMMIVFNIDDERNEAEFGIHIFDQKGTYVAGRAVKRFINGIFEKTDISRIYARIHSDNVRCLTDAKGIGFQYEGIEKQAFLVQGELKDVVIMSVLRLDYERKWKK